MQWTLADLIDVPLFQKLQDKLDEVYSFPSGIADNDGTVLTATAWQDVCTRFHRVHPESRKECIASDALLLERCQAPGTTATHRCPHGLVDSAIPIIIDGKRLGSFFMGQILLEEPDREYFLRQCRRFGFDEKAYMEAAERIPVWSQGKLDQYLGFIRVFVEILAGIGLRHIQELDAIRLVKEKDAELGQGRMLAVNDAYCRMSGYRRDELLAMSLADLEAAETPSETRSHIEKIVTRGEDRFESRHRRRDGTIFDVEISVQYRAVDGDRLVCFCRDITERKRSEAEVLKIQNLESLGALAGGIAHDFNNMLTSIMGNISLLKADIVSQDPRVELLEEAEGACQTAGALAGQLLTFASGGDPQIEPADLVPVVRVASRLATRGTAVAVRFEAPVPVLALADRDQVAQVVQNLVLNSVQAMPAGGSISIGLCQESLVENEIPSLAAGRYVRMSVKDTGTGIPAHVLPKVFDPFFSTKGKGRGLGLAVCHSIVSRHGGHIEVDSAPGCGTTFTVYLPATTEAPAAGPGAPRGRPVGGRFLLMDDNPTVLSVLGRMLLRLGYESTAVADGERALEEYVHARDEGTPFVAVVMDLTVEKGMGGEEAARRLKEIDARAKIIVSSGYATDPVVSDYAKHGFCGRLSKPYRVADVSVALSRALGEEGAVTAPKVPPAPGRSGPGTDTHGGAK